MEKIYNAMLSADMLVMLSISILLGIVGFFTIIISNKKKNNKKGI